MMPPRRYSPLSTSRARVLRRLWMHVPFCPKFPRRSNGAANTGRLLIEGKVMGASLALDLARSKHMPSRHAYRLANDDRLARDSALATSFESMCSSADCTQHVECSDADVCEGTRDDASKYPERCIGVVGSCSPPTGLCPLSASFRAFLGGRCESEVYYVGLKNALLAVGMMTSLLSW